MTAVSSAQPTTWQTVGTAIKDGVMWLGRTIKIGFQKAAPYLKAAGLAILAFLRTPAGLSTLAISIGAGLIGLAFSGKMEGEENKIAKIAVIVGAVILFVLGGVGITLAVTTGNAALI